MKIKNISNKIIHIGMITILPDSEANVPDSIGNSSSVQAIIEHGFLAVTEAKPVEVVEEETAEETVKKTRSRKSKAEINIEETME